MSMEGADEFVSSSQQRVAASKGVLHLVTMALLEPKLIFARVAMSGEFYAAAFDCLDAVLRDDGTT